MNEWLTDPNFKFRAKAIATTAPLGKQLRRRLQELAAIDVMYWRAAPGQFLRLQRTGYVVKAAYGTVDVARITEAGLAYLAKEKA